MKKTILLAVFSLFIFSSMYSQAIRVGFLIFENPTSQPVTCSVYGNVLNGGYMIFDNVQNLTIQPYSVGFLSVPEYLSISGALIPTFPCSLTTMTTTEASPRPHIQSFALYSWHNFEWTGSRWNQK